MNLMVIYHMLKVPFKVFDFVSPRLYMRLYIPFLAKLGVGIEGVRRYISPGCKFDDFNLVPIGDRAVISDRVVLLTHDYSLTTGLISIGQTPLTDQAFLKPILIGANTFIGLGAILLPGSTVEENTVIGAGSVLRGSVGPDAIAIGNPAVATGILTDKAKKWQFQSDRHQIRKDA